MKILVGMHGQFGDQFICLPFIEYLKEQYSNPHITKLINKRYEDAIPILKNCKYIDDFWISNEDEYEDFHKTPVFNKSFDLIFPAMPVHKDSAWFLKRHQTAEVFDMFGEKFNPEGYQINIPFKAEKKNEKWIAFAPYAGYYNPNNNKKLSTKKAQEIVCELIQWGYKILQIGGHDEPKLAYTHRVNLSYFESFEAIAESELFIHTDTGLGWGVSGIKHKCLGLYSNEGYGDCIKNIQPINPAGKYLDADNVNNIPLELILKKIQEMI